MSTSKPFGSQEKCVVCTKTVYPTERLASDERVYHKACFRCTVCNNALKLGNYASMESKSYCKPCFKKLFFTKGNYSEGFGKLKPQHEHDLKKGTPTVTSVAPVPTPINSTSSSSSSKTEEPVRASPDVVKPTTSSAPSTTTSASTTAPAKKYVPNTFTGFQNFASPSKPVSKPATTASPAKTTTAAPAPKPAVEEKLSELSVKEEDVAEPEAAPVAEPEPVEEAVAEEPSVAVPVAEPEPVPTA